MTDKNGRQRKRGWLNHPCTLMWKDHVTALQLYYNICILEWTERGYKNTMTMFNIVEKDVEMPPWLGDKAFHNSHKSNLLRKDKLFYSQFDWKVPDSLEYVWPKI